MPSRERDLETGIENWFLEGILDTDDREVEETRKMSAAKKTDRTVELDDGTRNMKGAGEVRCGGRRNCRRFLGRRICGEKGRGD